LLAGPAVVALDASQLSQTLDRVAAIGNRYHGTVGEVTCRDWIAEELDRLALERVRLEPFRYLAYEPGHASCRLLSPQRVDLPVRAVQFSADSEAGGEAVYVGTGTADDFERIDRLGIDLAGKVVVAHSIAPFMIAPFLERRQIAAFVNIGETPDGLVGNFTAALYRPPLEPPWLGRPVPYPAVTIENAAGRALLSTMTSGRPVEICVEHRATYVEKESANVVAEIPGHSRGRALVGAHYDSQLEGPCVWDNGTGVASLLEIARVLRSSEPVRTIDIVAFGVEEVGLWGSTVYTVAHEDELGDLVGMANLDAVASLYPAKRTIWTDEAMQPLALEAAAAAGWEVDVVFDAREFAFSDNTPFTDAGVPACWIWEFPPIHPFYHSAGDVRTLVDEHKLAETAGVTAQLVHALATVEELHLERPAAVVPATAS
jgi:peptidase M28-like protein